MMNEKKSYKVQIFEETYVLSSDEPEALVVKAAEMVDASMKAMGLQAELAKYTPLESTTAGKKTKPTVAGASTEK